MTRSIVVIAAHSDDEALGCGGTLARHAAAGDDVHLVFLADGVSSRNGVSETGLTQREVAADRAHKCLGVRSVSYFAFPDNRLDIVPLLDIVQRLEATLATLAPEVIYTHHHGDLNVDHRITHEAVMTACRPLPGSTVREIYAFEVMSSTEWSAPGLMPFVPQLSVDISAHLDTKLEALAAYQLEMRSAPHSRSVEHIRALALHRGHSAGVHAAEAFMVVRVLR